MSRAVLTVEVSEPPTGSVPTAGLSTRMMAALLPPCRVGEGIEPDGLCEHLDSEVLSAAALYPPSSDPRTELLRDSGPASKGPLQ